MSSHMIKDVKNNDSYKESKKNAVKMMLGVSDDITGWKSGMTIESLAKLYEINQAGNFCDSNMDQLKERLDKRVLGQPRVNLIFANTMTNWPQSRGPYRVIHLYGEEHSGRHYVVRSLAESMGRPVVRIDLAQYSQYSDLLGMEETADTPGRRGCIFSRIHKAGTTKCIVILENADHLAEMDAVIQDDNGGKNFFAKLKDSFFNDNFIKAPLDISNTIFIVISSYKKPLPYNLRGCFDMVVEMDEYEKSVLVQMAQNIFVPQLLAENKIKTKVVFSEETVRNIVKAMPGDMQTPYGVRQEFENRIKGILKDNGGTIKNKIKYNPEGNNVAGVLDGVVDDSIKKTMDDDTYRYFTLCKNKKAYTPAVETEIASLARRLKKKSEYSDSHSERNIRKRLELFIWSTMPSCGEENKFDREEFIRTVEKKLYGLSAEAEVLSEMIYAQSLKKKGLGRVALMLEGPNGTAKTSMARMLAQAMNYSLCEIDMNAVVRAETLCGHDGTYTGSEPGLLIKKMTESIKNALYSNRQGVVLLLEELEKCNERAAEVLLSVLDDRHHISDVYMAADCPLPKNCFVIATTNDSGKIPLAVRNRFGLHMMFGGYSAAEKRQIITNVILPAKENEYNDRFVFEAEDTAVDIMLIAGGGDAGLRKDIANLDRVLAYKVCRCGEDDKHIKITAEDVLAVFGKNRVQGTVQSIPARPGAVTALRFGENRGTATGVNSILLQGDGGCKTTGNLDKSIEECVQVVLSHIRHRYGMSVSEGQTLHIDLSSGENALNKGRSIGLALVASVVSALSGMPLKYRRGVTGTVNLYGDVGAVDPGSLRAKISAAVYAGCEMVIIPAGNADDIYGIDFGIEIKPVKNTKEMLDILLPSLL